MGEEMNQTDLIITQAGAVFASELHKQGLIVRNFEIHRLVPSSLNDNKEKKEICVTFSYYERKKSNSQAKTSEDVRKNP